MSPRTPDHSPRFLTLRQAAKRIPVLISDSGIRAWALRGVSGIKLRSKKIGGRRYTTQQWIEAFLEATNKAGEA